VGCGAGRKKDRRSWLGRAGLIHPPQLQHSDTDAGTQRTATWLKLFFDRAFAVVTSTNPLLRAVRTQVVPRGVPVALRLDSALA
jgi:hypothetical protein